MNKQLESTLFERETSHEESPTQNDTVSYGKASERTQGPGFGGSADSFGWPRP